MEYFELLPISSFAELNFRKNPSLRRSIAAETQHCAVQGWHLLQTREAPPARRPRDYASRPIS
jgi:hypothetical protein